MKARLSYNQRIIEVNIRIRQSIGQSGEYQIAADELGLEKGEINILTLANYQTREEAEKAMEDWRIYPEARKNSFYEILEDAR